MVNDKLAKVRAEIERRRNEIKKEEPSFDNYTTGWHDGKLDLLCDLLSFIDSMQKEPATSVWHDASETPKMYCKYLIRYADGRVNGSWERHDEGLIPWKDVVKEHKFTHWCYVEDLLKL